MNAWEEYQTAARRLDEIRRQAVAASAERGETLLAAREELVGVLRRLTLQHARFAEMSGRYRVRLPALSPTNTEINTVGLSGDPAEVLTALHAARSALDSADAELAEVGGRRRRRRQGHRASTQRSRNMYGAAITVALALLACAGFGAFTLFE